ncbi:hypothetical protein PoB_007585700 [Plakobranchus ocellatus]|uniref:Uncharacterized protein n=1 Tax=Plakobranchus ocellatus TaxID=259542 RepID=A0AAV4DYB6_9GAST|nr:hypothetical protein PoB_007585700 [Plakobranchus ocellatus]
MSLKEMGSLKCTLALLLIILVAALEAKTWVSCPDGNYFDSRKLECSKCTPYDTHDSYLVLEANCTSFHDTMLSCVDGFYYVPDPAGGSCHPCRRGDFRYLKKEEEEAIGQENHDYRFSAGTISLMVPLALIVMRFY